jgi:hypothetical protein
MTLVDELNVLRELHEKGNLTDQEYAAAKTATLKKQEATPASDGASARFLSWRLKAALVLLLILVGSIWYSIGTKNTTNILATAVHAPITLKDEVENLPASSVKSFGINVPYGGTVDITMEVVRGNPIDVFLTDAEQLPAIQKNDWNNVRTYTNFDALKTETYRRTGQVAQGNYYLVMRDTSLGILSSSASDISVKVELNP